MGLQTVRVELSEGPAKARMVRDYTKTVQSPPKALLCQLGVVGEATVLNMGSSAYHIMLGTMQAHLLPMYLVMFPLL